jgi:hypothetical protein
MAAFTTPNLDLDIIAESRIVSCHVYGDTMTRSSGAASGRFVLRIDPDLHARLRRGARREGTSLNDHCARRLSALQTSIPAPLESAITRADSLLGEDLVAVAAFGSWARGESSTGSDVDLLIVVEPSHRLSRSLYGRWDEAPVLWGTRTIEPQFVHLPGGDKPVAGLWAEVALDGIVLFDRDLRLSKRLVEVRREIASGRIVRRVVHGQPYWVRNEVA